MLFKKRLILGKPNLLELVKVRMKDWGRKVPRLVLHHLIAPHRHLLEMKASTWDHTKFVNELEGMGMNMSEMAGFVQKTIFQLATTMSYYQAKAYRNDKRQQEEIQSLANKLDEVERSEEELTKLQHEVQDLQEKATFAEFKAT